MAEVPNRPTDARVRGAPLVWPGAGRFRHRRRASPFAGALLLALTLLAVGGLPLDARGGGYAPILAYNGEEPPADSHFVFRAGYHAIAQPFTTGPNPAGYRVNAVAVHTEQSHDKRHFRFEGRIAGLQRYYVREWLVWLPGAPIGMHFYRHKNIRNFRWSWWRAMEPTHLQPNTTYAFVLDCMEGCADDNFVEVGRTDSDAEEDSTLPGWSIGDAMFHKSDHSVGFAGTGWSGGMLLGADGTFRLNPGGPAIRIRIEGRPVAASEQHSADQPVSPVSVSDARATEAPGAALAFDVTLDAPRAEALTLRFATLDGTATAGADYVSAAGTLLFKPGETAHRIEVTVLDDAHDEGEETLRLRLSDAGGTRLAGAEGTGTIVNDDPIPKLWLAHVGKIVGAQIADVVSARLSGKAQAHLTVAGATVWHPGGAAAADARDERDGPPAASETGQRGLPARADRVPGTSLPESSFHVSRPHAGEPTPTVWGRVATGRFGARADGMGIDGRVTTGLIGVDLAWDRWLVGTVASKSEADGAFGAASGDERRSIRSSLTGISPYMRFAPNERISLWALAGRGTGELVVGTAGRPIQTDIVLRMGALGARGAILTAPEGGGLDVAVRSDALWVHVKSEPVEESGRMAAADARANRLRLIVEGSRAFDVSEQETLTPAIALGVRRDGGDAASGTAIEVSATIGYEVAGITVEASVRGLLAHEASGYDEWGASGAIRIEPEASGRGLSFRLAPTVGAASSGLERLWSLPDAADLADGSDFEPDVGLESEFGYGMRGALVPGLLTPYTGLSLSDTEVRTWRAGVHWVPAPLIAMTLEGAWRERPGDSADFALTQRATMRW